MEPVDLAAEYERRVALAGFSARTKQRMNEYLPISTHRGSRHISDLVGVVVPLSRVTTCDNVSKCASEAGTIVFLR